MFGFRNKQRVWIIAGLGNPGPEYEGTRHNCGYMAIDRLGSKISDAGGSRVREMHKFKSRYTQCEYKGQKLILLKPETYMNLSGEAVSDAMKWFKTDESHLIVIYDDLDIKKGQIRVRPKGSAGTHNGMRSVLMHTDTDEFTRIRIGIGPKPAEADIIRFVLGHFTEEDRQNMNNAFDRAAEAALYVIENGTQQAMNLYNGAV